MADNTKIDDKNFGEIEKKVTTYARRHPCMDDDGNLNFEETVYQTAIWAMYNLPFKTIYGEEIGSPDNWYDFIIEKCVNLREILEEDLLNG